MDVGKHFIMSGRQRPPPPRHRPTRDCSALPLTGWLGHQHTRHTQRRRPLWQQVPNLPTRSRNPRLARSRRRSPHPEYHPPHGNNKNAANGNHRVSSLHTPNAQNAQRTQKQKQLCRPYVGRQPKRKTHEAKPKTRDEYFRSGLGCFGTMCPPRSKIDLFCARMDVTEFDGLLVSAFASICCVSLCISGLALSLPPSLALSLQYHQYTLSHTMEYLAQQTQRTVKHPMQAPHAQSGISEWLYLWNWWERQVTECLTPWKR